MLLEYFVTGYVNTGSVLAVSAVTSAVTSAVNSRLSGHQNGWCFGRTSAEYILLVAKFGIRQRTSGAADADYRESRLLLPLRD